MKTIVNSSAYQLSSNFPGEWKASYESYFARHQPRRLGPEEFWDAISDATGVHEKFQIKDLERKVTSVMETSFNQDFAASHKNLWNLLQDWGQTDREDPPTDRSSMIQAATLMNHDLILDRVSVKKGSRLEKLLEGKNTDEEIVQELFLATISRPPQSVEKRQALALLGRERKQGAEDLLWALVNRVDFIFNQ